MQIGFVGLGKMGLNMVKRALKEHEVFCFDINKNAKENAKKEGALVFDSIKEMISKMGQKKIIWVMVPSGKVTSDTIQEVSKFLKKDDIIIDGGNSYYKDSIEIGNNLSKSGINFLDIGTSGGIWGEKLGYCLMIGGEKKGFENIEPILKTLSKDNSYSYVGKLGTGHFVKMIHNAIEYGMMQAYAEGFEILKEKSEFDLDLKKIASLWNKGSVIRSWLLELVENVYEKDQNLKDIMPYVEDSGEGKWSIKEALDLNLSNPAITAALYDRFSSRKENSHKYKLLAALREKFGGHSVKKG